MDAVKSLSKFLPICLALALGFPLFAVAGLDNDHLSRKTTAILVKNNQNMTVFSFTVSSNDKKIVDFWREDIPVTLNYEYDGAILDRFPRNPKTDSDLGTRSTSCVRLRLDFIPSDSLLPGSVSFFSAAPDGPLLPLGQGTPKPSSPGSSIWTVLLQPVPELRATRTRTAFRPAPDGSSATESFVIALENTSLDPKTVQVVEHALRGTNIQVVAAGQESEIVRDGDKPPVILFPVRLSPESSKMVSYTVKYTW